MSPIVTIISPNWLDVENATIFLISFCVRAQMAVNKVVRAPRHKHSVNAVLLFSIIGLIRIRRKIPATTIVLEWSKADTGVGPSIAEGSHGWRPNWADFPAAARIKPIRGKVRFVFFERANICCISHEFRFIAIQAIAKIRPISPIRL